MQSISWFALTLSLVHGVLASCRSEAPSGASTSASAGAVDSARAARTKACLDALEPQRKQADAAREKRDDVQGALKRARASLASARERGESGAEAAAIFERNVRSISALNRARGTPTIWVGQVVNRERLKGEGLYGWLPRVRDLDLPRLLRESNALLERTAKALGDTYVALPDEAFGPADFVDQGHFSAAGARRFAALLAPVVRETCR